MKKPKPSITLSESDKTLSCSQMTVVFYHSVVHGLGFFIC